MDNAYWMIPPPRGEGALEVVTNYFQVAKKVLWVDKARGNDTTNDGSTNQPYASIQRAVEDVSGTDRTLIMVHPGEYDTNGGTSATYGNARVYMSGSHQLRIRSVEGASKTSIVGASDPSTLEDADYPGCGANAWRCVLFENKGGYTCQIQGFTLKGGRSAREGDGANGGAFLGTRDERFEDCVVTNCVSSNSLVFVSGGTAASVARCRFFDNTAYQYIVGGNGCSFSYFRGNVVLIGGSVKSGIINTAGFNCTAVGAVRDGRLVGAETYWDSIFDGGANLYSDTSGGGDIFFNYENKYLKDEDFTSYKLVDPCFVDRATDGVVCAHSPAVGFGEAFSATACRSEFWKVFNGDIDGAKMVIDADGKTLVGAFQRTVARSTVTINAPANGGLALEKGTFGENVLLEGDELVVVSAAGTRPCAGVTVNGETNILFETSPVHKIVLTCDVLGSGDFTVVPYYTTDWYVDDDGNDDNNGGFPSGAKRTLATTAELLVSGDTLHVLPGEYRSGTTEAKNLPCRVVVKSGTRVVSTDGPATTFICGETGVRCARVEKNSELSGFTLKDADIKASGESGAAVIGSGDTGGRNPGNGHKVSDCLIIGNSGQWPVYSCLMVNCRVIGNTAVTSAGGDSSLCYQVSAFGAYVSSNTCQRVFDYSLHVHDVTVATNNYLQSGEAVQSVVNSVAGSLVANSLMLLPGSYNANVSVTNSVLAAKSSINANASLGPDVIINANPADYLLDANGAPVVGANAAVDKAKPELCTVFPRGEKDARGFQRVMNGRGDIGALEGDWSARYAADLGKPRQLTVTRADPMVVEVAGGVAISNGVMDVSWTNDRATNADYSFVAQVTGTGTLTVTLNGESSQTLTAADGMRKLAFANELPVNALRFTYEAGAEDTGAALLSQFRRAGLGLMLIVR